MVLEMHKEKVSCSKDTSKGLLLHIFLSLLVITDWTKRLIVIIWKEHKLAAPLR